MSGNADIEEFYESEFTVYNPSGSVGVSCDGRGQVVALILDEEALRQGEIALADEIVALAGLARAKYRMGLRLHTLAAVAGDGPNVTDRTDRFCRRVQKLPTPEEYRDMESAEFATRYSDQPGVLG